MKGRKGNGGRNIGGLEAAAPAAVAPVEGVVPVVGGVVVVEAALELGGGGWAAPPIGGIPGIWGIGGMPGN